MSTPASRLRVSDRQARMLSAVFRAGGSWWTDREIQRAVLEGLEGRGLVVVRRDVDGGWVGSLTWPGWRAARKEFGS